MKDIIFTKENYLTLLSKALASATASYDARQLEIEESKKDDKVFSYYLDMDIAGMYNDYQQDKKYREALDKSIENDTLYNLPYRSYYRPHYLNDVFWDLYTRESIYSGKLPPKEITRSKTVEKQVTDVKKIDKLFLGFIPYFTVESETRIVEEVIEWIEPETENEYVERIFNSYKGELSGYDKFMAFSNKYKKRTHMREEFYLTIFENDYASVVEKLQNEIATVNNVDEAMFSIDARTYAYYTGLSN